MNMSTKNQLINQHIKAIYDTRKDTLEEIQELLYLKYWDLKMLQDYVKGRIQNQVDNLKELEKEEKKTTQLKIDETPKKA